MKPTTDDQRTKEENVCCRFWNGSMVSRFINLHRPKSMKY